MDQGTGISRFGALCETVCLYMSTRRRIMLHRMPANGGVESDIARTSDCRRMKNCERSESIMNKSVKTNVNWSFLRVLWCLFSVRKPL